MKAMLVSRRNFESNETSYQRLKWNKFMQQTKKQNAWLCPFNKTGWGQNFCPGNLHYCRTLINQKLSKWSACTVFSRQHYLFFLYLQSSRDKQDQHINRFFFPKSPLQSLVIERSKEETMQQGARPLFTQKIMIGIYFFPDRRTSRSWQDCIARPDNE